MYKVLFTNKAYSDYKKIKEDLILNTSYSRAQKILLALLERVISLETMPNRFVTIRRADEIYHKMPFKKYLVLYEVDNHRKIVTICRVLHGGIDIEKIAMA